MAKFTVVIPYYQKQHGVLGRALASVFSQTCQDFDLVIVDDESPYPIENELAELSAEQQNRIKVVKQPNAGPGGARNTALDNVPAETSYVAFLDSDDIWTPDHLKNAEYSLDTFGGECYWASMQASDEFYYHFAISELEKMKVLFGWPNHHASSSCRISPALCCRTGASCIFPAWSSADR